MIAVTDSLQLNQLRNEIQRLEGYRNGLTQGRQMITGAMQSCFPNGVFPSACVHEFIGSAISASTTGFVASLIGSMISPKAMVIWISNNRTVFPPGLATLGFDPSNFLFVDVKHEKDNQWCMEEALKCSAVTAVVSEMKDLTFLNSRRLQLAVEKSGVTGFVIRTNEKTSPTACVSRWRITSAVSEVYDGLPGIGFPRWRVELLRMKNGRPGNWHVEWSKGKFTVQEINQNVMIWRERKAG